MASENNLWTKMMLAIDQIDPAEVPETGYNDYHGYSYRMEGDVVPFVRNALQQNGIVCFPSVSNQNVIEHQDGGYLTLIDMEFLFVDTETGDQVMMRSCGQGHDSHEKGIYQAMTGCVKYTYMKLFMLASANDPEQVDSSSPPSTATSSRAASTSSGSSSPSDKQIAYLYDLLDERDNTNVLIKRLCEKYNLDVDHQVMQVLFSDSPDAWKSEFQQHLTTSEVSETIDRLKGDD